MVSVACGVINMPKTYKNQRGFSSVELALVILTSGLLLGALLTAMRSNHVVEQYRIEKVFDHIQAAMAEHLRVYGYYPCPADPTLALGVAGYSTGNCAAGGLTVDATGFDDGDGPPGPVLIGSVPIASLNQALNCVGANRGNAADTDDLFSPAFQDELNDAAQIAFDSAGSHAATDARSNMSVERVTCLSDEFMLDNFGNKITYAVTEYSTDRVGLPAAPGAPPGVLMFNSACGGQSCGGIRILDQNGNLAAQDSVHYVLVSHGPDEQGTYSNRGVPGTGANACGGGGLDDENCDGDETFRIMPYAQMQTGDEAGHFDDYVSYSIHGYEREDEMWNWAGDISLTSGGRSLVLGEEYWGLKIGVDYSSPNDFLIKTGPADQWERLKVYGNMLADDDGGADTGKVTAKGAFVAPRYCYTPGSSPFGINYCS